MPDVFARRNRFVRISSGFFPDRGARHSNCRNSCKRRTAKTGILIARETICIGMMQRDAVQTYSASQSFVILRSFRASPNDRAQSRRISSASPLHSRQLSTYHQPRTHRQRTMGGGLMAHQRAESHDVRKRPPDLGVVRSGNAHSEGPWSKTMIPGDTESQTRRTQAPEQPRPPKVDSTAGSE